MDKRNIVNIVNFIRGNEYRCEVDLLEPVREQLALLKKYGFDGTFLLQYDALTDRRFTDILDGAEPWTEIGAWFEIVEPLCADAGIPWRGEHIWDPHSPADFSAGYSQQDREKLVDAYFAKFREIYGDYPHTLGSWFLDAHTLSYACRKYGLSAACICKDQWGTDGYTFWGGFWNGAYYPSDRNMFCPAQSEDRQIPAPVFRMLGSDPIYQYDAGLDIDGGAGECQGVVTLEPVYTGAGGGGGVPSWVDWYFSQIFSGKSLTYAYTQAGQENSFGWPAMSAGLRYQFERLAALRDEGRVDVEPMGSTGEWYKSAFPVTAPACAAALEDWKGEGHRSVWYCCRNYRANVFCENGISFFRDIYIFDQDYSERYFETPCETTTVKFDTLPLADGCRFSGSGVRAGLFPLYDGKEIKTDSMEYEETDDTVKLTFVSQSCAGLTVTLSQEGIVLSCAQPSRLSLSLRYDKKRPGLPSMRTDGGNELILTHEGFEYRALCSGRVAEVNGNFVFLPGEGAQELKLTLSRPH